jgi:hypothetical protein
MTRLLGLLTFLLLYGPKLFGTIDLISITAALLVARALLAGRFRLPVRLLYPLGILCLLLLYSLGVALLSSYHDFYYPLRSARALLNVLGVFCLTQAYRERYKERYIRCLLGHVFVCTAIHGAIMLLQYLDRNVNERIAAMCGYEADGLRVSGLTVSFGVLSLTQGVGLILSPLVARNLPSLKWLTVVLLSMINGLSLLLAGRAGFYMTVPIWLTVAGVSSTSLVPTRRTIGLIALAVPVFALIAVFLLQPVLGSYSRDTLVHLFEPVRSVEESGEMRVRTLDAVAEMYFLPDDPLVLLFGSSISGRGGVYVPSDVGFVLTIFGIGLVGTAISSLFYIDAFVLLMRLRRLDIGLWTAAMLFTLSVVILNFKEHALLTRHALTITAFFLCLAAVGSSGKTPLTISARTT